MRLSHPSLPLENCCAFTVQRADGRRCVIIFAAMNMSLWGADLKTWITTDFEQAINYLITGNNEDPSSNIDKNLLYTQVAMAAIDTVQIPPDGAPCAPIKTRLTQKSPGKAFCPVALLVAHPCLRKSYKRTHCNLTSRLSSYPHVIDPGTLSPGDCL